MSGVFQRYAALEDAQDAPSVPIILHGSDSITIDASTVSSARSSTHDSPPVMVDFFTHPTMVQEPWTIVAPRRCHGKDKGKKVSPQPFALSQLEPSSCKAPSSAFKIISPKAAFSGYNI